LFSIQAKIFAEQWATNGKDIVERLKSSHVATHSVGLFRKRKRMNFDR